jgi:hypothetical protein
VCHFPLSSNLVGASPPSLSFRTSGALRATADRHPLLAAIEMSPCGASSSTPLASLHHSEHPPPPPCPVDPPLTIDASPQTASPPGHQRTTNERTTRRSACEVTTHGHASAASVGLGCWGHLWPRVGPEAGPTLFLLYTFSNFVLNSKKYANFQNSCNFL